MTNKNGVSVLCFEDYKVQVVQLNGEPWFIAKDVCAALGIVNSRDALTALDDDEKNTVALIYGIRGNPNRGVISESGFYKLISRSRKATKSGTFAHALATGYSVKLSPPSVNLVLMAFRGHCCMTLPAVLTIQ